MCKETTDFLKEKLDIVNEGKPEGEHVTMSAMLGNMSDEEKKDVASTCGGECKNQGKKTCGLIKLMESGLV